MPEQDRAQLPRWSFLTIERLIEHREPEMTRWEPFSAGVFLSSCNVLNVNVKGVLSFNSCDVNRLACSCSIAKLLSTLRSFKLQSFQFDSFEELNELNNKITRRGHPRGSRDVTPTFNFRKQWELAGENLVTWKLSASRLTPTPVLYRSPTDPARPARSPRTRGRDSLARSLLTIPADPGAWRFSLSALDLHRTRTCRWQFRWLAFESLFLSILLDVVLEHAQCCYWY